jgi:hypothetical protein
VFCNVLTLKYSRAYYPTRESIMRSVIYVLAVASAMVACQPSTENPIDIAPQRKQLEKAKTVEATLQQAADAQRAAIDKQEQPDSASQK